MKKVLLLGFLILTVLSCKAQSIIPIEKKIDYRKAGKGIPDNITYIKDVNHVLDKYVGTWKQTYDSKTYEFRMAKVTNKMGRITEDRLLMRFMVTDSNGTILTNTTALPDDSPYVVKGDYIIGTAYYLNYVGKVNNCRREGIVIVDSVKDNPNQIQLFLIPSYDMTSTDACPVNENNAQVIPQKLLTYTKQ